MRVAAAGHGADPLRPQRPAGLGRGEHIGAITRTLFKKGLDQLPLQGVVAERQEPKLLPAENQIAAQIDSGNVR